MNPINKFVLTNHIYRSKLKWLLVAKPELKLELSKKNRWSSIWAGTTKEKRPQKRYFFFKSISNNWYSHSSCLRFKNHRNLLDEADTSFTNILRVSAFRGSLSSNVKTTQDILARIHTCRSYQLKLTEGFYHRSKTKNSHKSKNNFFYLCWILFNSFYSCR